MCKVPFDKPIDRLTVGDAFHFAAEVLTLFGDSLRDAIDPRGRGTPMPTGGTTAMSMVFHCRATRSSRLRALPMWKHDVRAAD